MHITRIGRTRFGTPNKSLLELFYEAIYIAIDDSPLEIDDINVISCFQLHDWMHSKPTTFRSLMTSLLPGTDLPSFRVESAYSSRGTAVLGIILNSLL